MTYDPVGLINTSIAAVIATATALVLWAVVAPQRRRRRAAGLSAPRQALCTDRGAAVAHQPRRVRDRDDRSSRPASGYLRDDQPEDIAIFEAGTASSAPAAIDPDAREPPLLGRG